MELPDPVFDDLFVVRGSSVATRGTEGSSPPYFAETTEEGGGVEVVMTSSSIRLLDFLDTN